MSGRDGALPPMVARWGRFLWLWGPTVLYMALVFWLSSMPRPPELLRRLASFDALCHAGEYAVLGLLLCRSLVGSGPVSRMVGVMSLGAFYGMTDELHQRLVPGRSSDVLDWLADLVGVALGIVVWGAYLRWQRLGRVRADGATRASAPPKRAR